MKAIPVLLFALLLGSCRSGSGKGKATHSETEFSAPAPGTIVAEDSMPVTEDQLNHSTFRVRIKAGAYSEQGTYDVEAAYGQNVATNQFTMPRGGAHLRPLLRKGADPYTFTIGFQTVGDETFYEYYLVRGSRNAIEMKYLKAYSFE